VVLLLKVVAAAAVVQKVRLKEVVVADAAEPVHAVQQVAAEPMPELVVASPAVALQTMHNRPVRRTAGTWAMPDNTKALI